MNSKSVCLAALAVVALMAYVIWLRDSGEVIIGPRTTAEKIQARLDGLPPGGGTVVLRPGVYMINNPLFLRRDNQRLRGAGPATVLRLADNANCPLLVMGTAENAPSRVVMNLRISDLEIDGNRAHQQFECWAVQGEGSDIRNNGITVRGVSDSSVERVRCHDCRSGGLVTEKGVIRLTVSDFASWDNQYDGLAAYVTEDSLFTRLMLHNNPGAGISLDQRVAHCVISEAMLARNGCGIFMRHASDNLFHGITVRDSKEHGVFLSQAATSNLVERGERMVVAWTPIPGTACTGNVFTGLQITDSGGAGFEVAADTCVGNMLNAARFARNRECSFWEIRPGLLKTAALQEE